MKELPIIYTDRSRIEAYQSCPRKRYIGYEWNDMAALDCADDDRNIVGGISPNRPRFDMEIGSGVHKGVEILLLHCVGNQQPISLGYLQSYILEEAIEAGLQNFNDRIQPFFAESLSNQQTGEYDPENDDIEPWNNYVVEESKAMIEALIRAFVFAPEGLAGMLEKYEILAAEKEIDWELPMIEGGNESVIVMSRPDAILRDRSNGQVWVWSLKTAKTWDKRMATKGKYDNQGISELLAVESLGEKVSGVLMTYLLKGYKSQDKSDQQWKYSNGLIRPYNKLGVVGSDDEMRFSYNWTDTDGKNHTLGYKNWSKVNIWEHSTSLKEWVEMLVAGGGREDNDVSGENGYDEPGADRLNEFVVNVPYIRSENDCQEWIRQTYWQETHIADSLKLLNLDESKNRWQFPLNSSEITVIMDSTFPKYRNSCSYPTPCEFISICHEGMDEEMGLAGGAFKLRVANHKQEVRKNGRTI